MKRLDYLLIIGLILLTGLYSADALNSSIHPFEDAAMLLRYSQHLAEGHGIVWNVGEEPLDGATDFLFMVVVAGLAKLGLGLEAAARGVTLASHILTVLIVYLAINRLGPAGRWAAALSAAYLALGPGKGYIAACFGTPFFALFASITWYLAGKLVKTPNSSFISSLFALSGLVMGLIRPEGVFLAFFMLFAVIYMAGIKHSGKVMAAFLCVFVILGGAYFLWR